MTRNPLDHFARSSRVITRAIWRRHKSAQSRLSLLSNGYGNVTEGQSDYPLVQERTAYSHCGSSQAFEDPVPNGTGSSCVRCAGFGGGRSRLFRLDCGFGFGRPRLFWASEVVLGGGGLGGWRRCISRTRQSPWGWVRVFWGGGSLSALGVSGGGWGLFSGRLSKPGKIRRMCCSNRALLADVGAWFALC